MVVALFCLNIAMLAQAVSLKMNNVSVKEAMTQLKNKSGYSFVYKVGDLDTRKIVSVKAKQLNEAIDQILYGQEVVYEVKGKNIIVQKGQPRPKVLKDSKKRKIMGVVNDLNGEPIIGATVKEKGDVNGTATDLDAKFVAEAKAAGFENLKGHRTVGGMRASIYNAMPKEGVEKLVEFMKKFEEENA